MVIFMSRRSFILALSLILLLSGVLLNAGRVSASQEPDYEIETDFGSIGINGYIYDTSSGAQIPDEDVSFWILPNSADSAEEVEKIKVEATGYVPSYVSNFGTRGINLGFKQLLLFQLGRVGLTSAKSKRLPRLTVESSPSEAAIYIDGNYEGRTPVHRMKVEAGNHELRLSKRGYRDWSTEFYLNSGEAKEITAEKADLERKNEPPEADFIYSPSGPSSEESVKFASRSQDPDGRIAEYRWKFGDGAKDWGKETSHPYDRRGEYSVTLTVTDEDGASDSKTKKVEVHQPNEPPNSDFTYSPTSVGPGEIVGFDSQATDPDGYVSSWQWEFGDGSESSDRSPEHQYEESGTYTVSLTVKDQAGASDSESKEIKVGGNQPRVKFELKPNKPRAGEDLTFDASSSKDPDGRIVKYKWDLDGDGEVDKKLKEPILKVEYDQSGKHSVELTVEDEEGNENSTKKEFKIRKRKPADVDIEDKYGLVVGISEYKYEEKCPKLKLKYAAKDARAFKELLVSDKYGRFDEDKVTLLTNEEATRESIDRELQRLVTEANKNDLVVIYYSGHGAPGPDYNDDEKDSQDEYYITYGTRPESKNSIFLTAYRDDSFADRVKSLRSNQVAVFLDSCYSGGATKSIKGFSVKGLETPKRGTVFKDFNFEEGGGSVLFAASKENQTSYEGQGKEIKHGVFTYFLLKALRGEADENNDGSVSTDELEDYIVPHVSNYVDEHNLPEKTYGGTPQTPLVKGGIVAPIVEKGPILQGKIKYVVGGKKAMKGDKVMIDLGTKKGVEKGDKFRVYGGKKGVDITGKGGALLKLQKVIGPGISLCEVVRTESNLRKGLKVRIVTGESR